MERPSRTEDGGEEKVTETSLAKEIAHLHGHRGDPIMPASEVPSALYHFTHLFCGGA